MEDKQKSFTLIELLMVIAIIGLLASVVLVAIKGTKDKARIAKGLEFSQSIFHSIGANVVGIWGFDNCAAQDTSGYKNNGTIYGATCVSDTPHSIIGQGSGKNALSFDGVNDYVQLPSKMKIGAKTIELWVYPTDATHANTLDVLLAETAATSNSYGNQIYWDHNLHIFHWSLFHSVAGNYYINLSSSVFSPNAWYYLVFTWNGTTNTNGVKCYVNGILNTQTTATGIETTVPTYNTRIGRDYYSVSGGRYFEGSIDDVRIYGEALTSAQIQKHYAEGKDAHPNLAGR